MERLEILTPLTVRDVLRLLAFGVRTDMLQLGDRGGFDLDAKTAGSAAAAKLNTQDDLDYLDIPAFLRRQAD